MQNIEVKCPLRDRRKAEVRLEALGARKMWTRRQVDTFFRVPVRGSWLKLRECEGRPAELISYTRSTEDSRPRPSEYDVLIVKEPNDWKRLLSRVLPIDVVVAKERTLWIYEHTRVHLDAVEGLGEFIELETVVDDLSEAEARSEAERIIEVLAMDRGEFIAVPYRDLVAPR
ncbi:MAG: class IV adenylate cyclase [Planctomycetota bacterium]